MLARFLIILYDLFEYFLSIKITFTAIIFSKFFEEFLIPMLGNMSILPIIEDFTQEFLEILSRGIDYLKIGYDKIVFDGF
jgi:hypothetical protein